MKLRTYRVPTVEAAMKRAVSELGDQAIFVGSRENPGEAADKDRHDVTFALFDPEETRKRAAAASQGHVRRHASAGAVAQAGASGSRPPAGRSESQARTVDAHAPRIDRPHWKKFVPADLKSTLTADRGSVMPASKPAATGAAVTMSGAAAQPALAPAAPAAEPPLTATPATDHHDASPLSGPPPASTYSPPPPATSPSSRFAARVDPESQRIRRLISAELATNPFAEMAEAGYFNDPSRADLLTRLLAAELDPALCRQLLSTLPDAAASDPQRTVSWLRTGLAELVETAPEFDASPNPPLITAFVGPHGSGKTSAALKLALRLAVGESRKVHLVALTGQRIAAAEPTATYARLARIPFTVVDRESNLLDRLRSVISGESPAPDVVFVDLPGYTNATREQGRELAAQLGALDNVHTHLVLDAGKKESARRQAIDFHQIFRPSKLLFTRLDETPAYGAVIADSRRTGLPLGFLSMGPTIPDDIEAADTSRIADRILGMEVNGI